MNIDETGLYLTKNELTALLAFASDDEDRLHLHAVQFKADGARVRAYASNGHVAVEATGNCDGVVGSWLVQRSFLEAARKLIVKKTRLRLNFEGLSLRDAVVVDETDEIHSTISWPDDAALLNAGAPDVRALMDNEWSAKPEQPFLQSIVLSAEYIALLKFVTRAANRTSTSIRVFSPTDPRKPVFFSCLGTETVTDWRAVIMPHADNVETAA